MKAAVMTRQGGPEVMEFAERPSQVSLYNVVT
ncbi:hypothetical protein ABID26_005629 [Mesorhizobium shonense]|uniref:Uncharacterized protein n=1 Tax=Mesorhizobium shonense TaxID=1209948 RepID=A0ABV2I1M1_9HYPH